MTSRVRARPPVYWTDLLASAALGWGAFAIGATTSGMALVASTLVAALLLLRALTFLHEIAHRRAGELPGFEWAWNLVVGIPMCVPSLVYVGAHLDHHRADRFGTERDPEYAPIASWSRARTLVFLLGSALVPLLLVVRWGLLAPLSTVLPPLRRLVVAKASTLAINPGYDRRMPSGRARRRWVALEASTCAFVWLVLGGWLAGAVPSALLLQWLGTFAFMFVVNQARTLAAHRFTNDGAPLTLEEQVRDSVTLPGRSPATALVAPVGLRYHALHHLRPGLPYHELGRVHRAMVAEAGTDHPYRATLAPGLLPTLGEILPPRVR